MNLMQEDFYSTDYYRTDGFNYRHSFQTKCGWPARLVGVLQRRAFPLVIAVWNPAFKAEEMHCYNLDGKAEENYVPDSVDPEKEPSIGIERLSQRMAPLSLVNTRWWLGDTPEEEAKGVKFERVLKATDFVHAVVTHEPVPMDVKQSSNPFHYDFDSMGTDLVCGWMVMHQGFDNKEEPRPLEGITLVNCRSGQRIRISLLQTKIKEQS